ncbi:MAG: ArnT family glycosyltransferase [Bacteroidia bacterium]|jgi:4-amino-4-deoxy-L-arabinose transferase-like glycosyltransferase
MGTDERLKQLEPWFTSPRFARPLLVFLSVFFYLGLGGWSLLDWDEINFAESAREMLATGDYGSVQINYRPFYEKPPLFMLVQAGMMKIFGVGEMAARLPNALLGTIYLLTLYEVGRRWYTQRMGWLWAVLFWATLLPHAYFKSGIIDPMFNYFILLSVFALFRAMHLGLQGTWKAGWWLAAGTASGLAVLTKGPVGFLLLALTALFWIVRNKSWSSFWWKGAGVFGIGLLVPVLSWVALEWWVRGPSQLLLFWSYMIDLFRTGVAGHEQPFYYHALVLMLGCLPAVPLALPLLFRWQKTDRTEDFSITLHQSMWALFWVVLVVFSMSTTKIIHYSSLAYVPLAYLGASFLVRDPQKGSWPRWLSGIFTFQVVLWSVILGAIPWVMRFKASWIDQIKDVFVREAVRDALPWSGWESLWIVPLPFLAFWGWQKSKNHRPDLGVPVMGLGVALLVMGLTFSYLPRIASVTQTPAVNFYQSLAGQKVYAGTWGFKSYAPFFYLQIPFDPASGNSSMPTGDELLQVHLDRPVFLVTRVDRPPDTTTHALVRHRSQGGYVIYRRLR